MNKNRVKHLTRLVSNITWNSFIVVNFFSLTVNISSKLDEKKCNEFRNKYKNCKYAYVKKHDEKEIKI